MAIIKIDKDLCVGCGLCTEICPMDVLTMEDDQAVINYFEDCISCFTCELACPSEAIYVGPERARAIELPW